MVRAVVVHVSAARGLDVFFCRHATTAPRTFQDSGKSELMMFGSRPTRAPQEFLRALVFLAAHHGRVGTGERLSGPEPDQARVEDVAEHLVERGPGERLAADALELSRSETPLLIGDRHDPARCVRAIEQQVPHAPYEIESLGVHDDRLRHGIHEIAERWVVVDPTPLEARPVATLHVRAQIVNVLGCHAKFEGTHEAVVAVTRVGAVAGDHFREFAVSERLEHETRVQVVSCESIHLPAQNPLDRSLVHASHEFRKNRATRCLGRTGFGQNLHNANPPAHRDGAELVDLRIDREDLPVIGFRGFSCVDDVGGHDEALPDHLDGSRSRGQVGRRLNPIFLIFRIRTNQHTDQGDKLDRPIRRILRRELDARFLEHQGLELAHVVVTRFLQLLYGFW